MQHFCRSSCCLLVAMMALGTTAYAENFTFNASGSMFSATGTLTAVPDSSVSGAFDITGITGTVTFNTTAETITGLLPCAAYSVSSPCTSSGPNTFTFDNLLYPAGVPPLGIQVLDQYGVAFAFGSSGEEGDFFASSSHLDSFNINTAPPGAPEIITSFTVSPTPEPSSFVLLGTGLLGMAASAFRHTGSPENERSV